MLTQFLTFGQATQLPAEVKYKPHMLLARSAGQSEALGLTRGQRSGARSEPAAAPAAPGQRHRPGPSALRGDAERPGRGKPQQSCLQRGLGARRKELGTPETPSAASCGLAGVLAGSTGEELISLPASRDAAHTESLGTWVCFTAV